MSWYSTGTNGRSAATESVMKDANDRRALKRIAQGDTDALAALYDRHAALLAMRLRRNGASPAETEDVLQETFLDVWQCAASFRGYGAVAAWLWGMAKRKLAMVVRGEVRGRTRERAATREPIHPVSQEGAWAVAIDADAALRNLSPEYRSAFVAVVVEGMSIEQAADHLDVPTGTVKSRVHRARRAMKEEMQ